jgi:serine/threonine-protein phosphatase 2A regulatory subunit A
VPFFALKMGTAAFDERMMPICMGWLTDKVFSVREGAIVAFRRLATQFGKQWVKQSLIQRLVALSKEKSYIHREVALAALLSLSAPALPPATSVVTSVTPPAPPPAPAGPPVTLVGEDVLGGKEGVVATVVTLTKDRVPNVRFSAVRALRVLYGIVDSSAMKREIKMAMERMLNDEDWDVKYFAEQAIEGLK